MRISDWSSDVCSSDLGRGQAPDHERVGGASVTLESHGPLREERPDRVVWLATPAPPLSGCHPRESGDPWCRLASGPSMDPGSRSLTLACPARQRVVLGTRVSVRVDHGGRSII